MEIYVHIPFCVRKCAYCDFLSFSAEKALRESYVCALLREIRQRGAQFREPVTSIFIGGGTPSILEPSQLGRILEALTENFTVSPQAEISMEANPGTLGRETLQLCKSLGVNRLSLGLQSPKDRELAVLGRIHNYRQFLESYELAKEAGFDNINIDLMFALPGQTREAWAENLETVAALKPAHISAYSLIIEEGTPFASRTLDLPDEDTEYQMYEDTARILAAHGYVQYEISNYAQPGRECVHNLGYWTGVPYLGLGLGAASLTGNMRFSNTRSIEEYIKYSAEEDFSEKIQRELVRLEEKDRMEEFMILGLRLTRGIRVEEFADRFGVPLAQVYGPIIQKYKGYGLLQEEDGRLFFTRRGIHVSNTVLADFLLERGE